MENPFRHFFRRRKNPPTADTGRTTPVVEPPVPYHEKRTKRTRLARELAQAGYNLGELEERFDDDGIVIGTTDPSVFRYIQLHSELGLDTPVAIVVLNIGFSDREAIQSIIHQVTGDTTPVPGGSPYGYLKNRIQRPYTLAVSIASGLQHTASINSFADMFRTSNSRGAVKRIVYYENQEDIPTEIGRSLQRIPTPTPKI